MSDFKEFSVAIVDDHVLFRSALAGLVQDFKQYDVIFQASNGKEVISQVENKNIPNVILMDINMPEMNGFETTQWLSKKYPQIKVLALTMESEEMTIIKMLKCGARGYILKNVTPNELKIALDAVIHKNYYLSEEMSLKIVNGLRGENELAVSPVHLSEKEIEYLKYVALDLDKDEIAEKLFLSKRSLDDYRLKLFEKLKVNSSIGLVIYAIKHKIVQL